MYHSALDHLIKKLNEPYPHYRIFRKGTKYEYRTVFQYEIFGPEFIAEPFIDGIRTRDGTPQYHVYFAREIMVLEYRQQRRKHDEALIEEP